jgi:hypothetical protein
MYNSGIALFEITNALEIGVAEMYNFAILANDIIWHASEVIPCLYNLFVLLRLIDCIVQNILD